MRIVGHSLGAGCAALLSIALRSSYPSLRGLCFCPQGQFITWKLATQSKDFLTSYIFGNDLIPRLSVQNMEQLRNETLNLIGRISVPKIQVLRYIILDDGDVLDPQDDVDSLLNREIPKDSVYYKQLK